MQEQPATTPPSGTTPRDTTPVAPTAPTSSPAEPAVEIAPQDPNAQPSDAAATAQRLEDELREKGERIEAAAKDLGRQLDEKLSANETTREVKQKVGGFWNRIKESIK